ncbi:MAG: hypothetical protein CO030_01835 [Candidatus Magasanikbacteria bacterium CG_4_9_14_0_2_um_filter_42_11]|uniref:Uncharacterized protein n=1 Tax=Candidatus Magasanikbacteria bacterium CG_4_9_14_0_2_um_filter_42_11 TaxID=1974643 RepID=A0A2M8FAD7_9BACT|nr:MAG: hypothetical protein COU34_04850 [Candidatus Magasanikbacteria bacterium CG10_big_fil_rev_8_21_14_0_10_43_9]PIY92301.1 MAG: hypothetical protein COY70_03950 [Candidatus Magasanikbacteria bacterium CG_4_10_14_0_8_um_filter_42_12]PJC52629.1 MAG: hypothetical protein CO030_01835 [Candidatus Magasanikbacteria bacterium CG_4_9_14_0_2_um_filter_42_11]
MQYSDNETDMTTKIHSTNSSLQKQKNFLEHDLSFTLPFIFTRLISITAGSIVHGILELIFLNIILFCIAKMIIRAIQRGYAILCKKGEKKIHTCNLDDSF